MTATLNTRSKSTHNWYQVLEITTARCPGRRNRYGATGHRVNIARDRSSPLTIIGRRRRGVKRYPSANTSSGLRSGGHGVRLQRSQDSTIQKKVGSLSTDLEISQQSGRFPGSGTWENSGCPLWQRDCFNLGVQPRLLSQGTARTFGARQTLSQSATSPDRLKKPGPFLGGQ